MRSLSRTELLHILLRIVEQIVRQNNSDMGGYNMTEGKYYSITGEGKKFLKSKTAEWNEYSGAIASVLAYGGC